MKPSRILSITPSGLIYQSLSGQTVFVDFEQCKQNFTKWLQFENGLTDEETKELEMKTRCVAIRDAFEDPQYIEFISEPKVRFEFKKTLFKDEYKEFRKLDLKINEVGWKTFDMG
ncbi:hypothetical protein [Paenibacillus harenae]|uniref:hypothetical protein n=1 Tax=Paenibacillus harenae TaxID=306543 RepID=UPI002792A629|nr:hypothetical protein [Paenibacillus harenae]MDQ0059984.1 hypothetical protein [Paenibacillus harenae]